VRQFAPTADDYLWSDPDFNTADCLTLESEYAEPWARYRQSHFTASTPDCRVFLEFTSTSDATVKRSIETVVWPDRAPEEQGTLFDLDIPVSEWQPLNLVGQG